MFIKYSSIHHFVAIILRKREEYIERQVRDIDEGTVTRRTVQGVTAMLHPRRTHAGALLRQDPRSHFLGGTKRNNFLHRRNVEEHLLPLWVSATVASVSSSTRSSVVTTHLQLLQGPSRQKAAILSQKIIRVHSCIHTHGVTGEVRPVIGKTALTGSRQIKKNFVNQMQLP